MCGGFGTLLTLIYDNVENQKGWEKSMNLFANDVMPRFRRAEPGLAPLSPRRGAIEQREPHLRDAALSFSAQRPGQRGQVQEVGDENVVENV